MNNDSIELLPEEMRRKKKPEKEKREKEIAFIIPEKDVSVPKEEPKEEKTKKIKETRSFFDFFKNLFRKPSKEKIKVPQEKEISAEALKEEIPEVSLMPEKITVTSKLLKRKILTLGFAFIVCCLLILVFSLFLNFFYHKKLKKLETIKEEIKKTDEKISNFSDMVYEIKNLDFKISKINRLLENHIYFTKFFSFLERYTLPEIYYKDISLDTSGKIILPAIAKDFPSLLKQLTIFQSAPDFVKEVKFSGLTKIREEGGEEKGFEFKIDLTLIDNFYKK